MSFIPAGMESDSEDDDEFFGTTESQSILRLQAQFRAGTVTTASSPSPNENVPRQGHAPGSIQHQVDNTSKPQTMDDQEEQLNSNVPNSKLENGLENAERVSAAFPERLFEDYDDEEANPNHWRKYRMHKSLPAPIEDFRMSAMQGNLPVMKSLIEQGIPPDTIMKSGWTALMYACSCGIPEIVQLLLEQKADPNFHKERFTPLMAACASSKDDEDALLKCVQLIIASGADVNAFERHHVTPLMFAARDGRLKLVQALLNHGADCERIDNRGWNALTWAISNGHTELVRLLLKSNMSAKNIKNSGQTLADFAYEHGHKMIAEILDKYAETKVVPDASELVAKEEVPSKDEADIVSGNGLAKSSQKPKFAAFEYGDLEMFLSGLKLEKLIPIFHAHKLSYADVLRITDKDLEKIGINKLGWRKLILDGIREVHRTDWQNSSLPNFKDKKFLSCPDAVCMIANIGKHLSYIKSTIVYLRCEIEAKPRILELGQEANNIRTLLRRIDDAMKHGQNLQEELRFLRLHLDKIQDNVEFLPADLIVEKRSPDTTPILLRRPSICAALLLGAAVVGGTAWKKPDIVARLVTWRLWDAIPNLVTSRFA